MMIFRGKEDYRYRQKGKQSTSKMQGDPARERERIYIRGIFDSVLAKLTVRIGGLSTESSL